MLMQAIIESMSTCKMICDASSDLVVKRFMSFLSAKYVMSDFS